MVGSISPADGKWFGVVPPDLVAIARAKSQGGGVTGSDYIYTYLRTFFRDTSRPTGWDNLVFPSAAMPHALWQRQGPREMVAEVIHPAAGGCQRRSRCDARSVRKGHHQVRRHGFLHDDDRSAEGLPGSRFVDLHVQCA